MNNNKGIVEISDFSLFYGDKQALVDISLLFPEKKITAIMGPSGCGKSTLLRAINRMNHLIPCVRTEGEISFDGKNVYRRGVDIYSLRRRIGMVFQRPNPFPKSIYDNVAYGLRIHKLARGNELDDRIEYALKAVNLWDEVNDRLNSNAFELSGGQQQRLCVARAIAVEPEIILLNDTRSCRDAPACASLLSHRPELLFWLSLGQTHGFVPTDDVSFITIIP